MSPISSVPIITHELLNRITGSGLSATYSFTRTVSVAAPKMISIEMKFTNNSDKPITNLKITDQVGNTIKHMSYLILKELIKL